MSFVTDTILLGFMDEIEPQIPAINSWLKERTWGQFKRVDQSVGGGKAFQADCYIAAFNYLGVLDFIDFLRTLPWGDADEIQLCYKDENDVRFSLVTIHEAPKEQI